MSKQRFSGAGKFAAISLAIAAAVAMPLGASARGWGGHGHQGGHHYSYNNGYHNNYRNSYRGGYYGHRGHWSGGRWIAGAIVTGAVVGLVADALNPRPVYYGPPVVYDSPNVVYSYGPPPVQRRVVVTRTVTYGDPDQTRYIRDDGYDGD